MPETTKAEWLALLKNKLNEAEDRLHRWQKLGHQLNELDSDVWVAVAELKQLEIETLRQLIKRNEDTP